jgi:integrase
MAIKSSGPMGWAESKMMSALKTINQRAVDADSPKGCTLTFGEQAEKFIAKGTNRKRNPMRFNTLRTYATQIKMHLLPLLGSKLLEDVGNKAVKNAIEKLEEKKLSPATISLNLNIIKQIVASATDEEGEQLFPRKWNSEHIDAPAVEDQKRPTISITALQGALAKAEPIDKALYAILASTGLRISEALALMSGKDEGIGNAWIPEESKLIIRCQREGGIHDETVVGPPKTKAGKREVDLAPELNDFLKASFSQGYALMFPESEATYRVRLEQNGVKGGFHCFRRFRTTHIDGEGVPGGLQRFWTGHAAKDVHEGYIKSGEKIRERKEWAAKAGLGFKLETT